MPEGDSSPQFTDIATVRHRNFKDVLAAGSMNKHLAALMDCSAAHVSLLTRGTRRLNEDTARGLETVLGLPSLWMDKPQDSTGLPELARMRLNTGRSPIAFPDVTVRRGRPRASREEPVYNLTAEQVEAKLKSARKTRQRRIRNALRVDFNVADRRVKGVYAAIRRLHVRVQSLPLDEPPDFLPAAHIERHLELALEKLEEVSQVMADLVEGLLEENK